MPASEIHTIPTSLADIVQNDLGVATDYRHTPKNVTPGEPVKRTVLF